MVARLQESADFAVRILHVAERHASCRTDGDAGRVEPFLNTMDTERAFVSIAVWMDEPRIIRTRGNTRLTADAHTVFNKHNSTEVVDMTGTGGTRIHTRWIAAMIASLRSDFHVERWIFPLDLIFNPIAIQPFRNAILGLARHNAIHATDALRGIDDHPEPRHGSPPLRWSRS
jgi:hypothetical protein